MAITDLELKSQEVDINTGAELWCDPVFWCDVRWWCGNTFNGRIGDLSLVSSTLGDNSGISSSLSDLSGKSSNLSDSVY